MKSLRALMLVLAGALAGCAGTPDGGVHRAPAQSERLEIVGLAHAMLGKPYRYGGAHPSQGFDCSGLVHYTHDQAGIRVPRTARAQRSQARGIDVDALRPGDLVFFRTGARARHVGIYVGGGQFIHAPSRGGVVRKESISGGYWRQRLIGAGHYY
jgi:cell wall-associated NlpC family hydrolase